MHNRKISRMELNYEIKIFFFKVSENNFKNIN
jgi:hypothetical protein